MRDIGLHERKTDMGNKSARDIHVCFATDDGYVTYCAVAIKSIVMNAAPNDRLFIYVLYANLSMDKIKILEDAGNASCSSVKMIKIDKTDFEDVPLVPGVHFSHIETYFSFAIPRIFRNLSKVLYLDCDILVRNSLWPIYNAALKGKTLGMVRGNAYELMISEKRDFNAGVILIDCNKWRDNDVEDKLLQYARENRNIIKLVDQDVINGVLQSDIFEFENKYNKQIRMRDLSEESIDKIIKDQDIVILHYITDVKPWHGTYQNKIVEEYFSYMRKTSVQHQNTYSLNRNIDKEKYYAHLSSLRYLLDLNVISKDTELLLIFEEKISYEFEFAANELGILQVGSVPMADVVEESDRHAFMMIDGCDHSRILSEMRLHGYVYRKDYCMLCSVEDYWIEKELMQCSIGLNKKIVVYGTANWANKCTEALIRVEAQILFYMDSDKRKDGDKFNGKDVIHLDTMMRSNIDYDKIVIASSAFAEIKESLLERGIDEGKILTFDFMRSN